MRILAWWSVYLRIEPFSWRRARARPLRHLEAAFGCRMWVSGVETDFNKRPGIYHFDAYSVIEAERIEDVIGMILRRRHRLGGVSESSPYPVQRVVKDDADFDGSVLGAF